MTCREKLAQEHPDEVGPDYIGGCANCPSTYGYLDNPKNCTPNDGMCTTCWDREIPEKKIIEPVPITMADHTRLCDSGDVDKDTVYQVYSTEDEVRKARYSILAKKAGIVDISVECTTCVHRDVCAYRESFIDIIGATQHSNGICAHVGSETTIDLNSTPYVMLNISCKHYHRKGEV